MSLELHLEPNISKTAGDAIGRLLYLVLHQFAIMISLFVSRRFSIFNLVGYYGNTPNSYRIGVWSAVFNRNPALSHSLKWCKINIIVDSLGTCTALSISAKINNLEGHYAKSCSQGQPTGNGLWGIEWSYDR